MNILIADDEALIRTSLRMYLEDTGILPTCVFEAPDASEMKRILNCTSIDVTFVDICMPGMNGLEAISQYRDIQPDVSFYIISGYSKFQYAHEAIRLRVIDYLLKPIDPQKVRQIVRHEEERLLRQAQTQDRQLLSELHLALIKGQPLASRNATLLFLTEGTGNSENMELALERLMKWAASMQAEAQVMRIKEGNAVCIAKTMDAALLPRQGQRLALGGDCGLLIPSLPYYVDAQRRIQEDLCFRWLVPRGECRLLDKAALITLEPWRELCKLAEELHMAACEKDYARFCSYASQFCARIAKASSSAYCAHLLHSTIIRYGLAASQCTDGRSLLNALNKYATKLVMEKEQPRDLLDEVKAYIEQNYAVDLNVKMLSAQFGIAPNYLSSIFKKKYGVGIIQYLTHIRVSESKRLLLASSLSVQQIAEKCGYTDSAYFTRVFSKAEHCSPAQYKKTNA